MTIHTVGGVPGHFFVELNDGTKSIYGGFYPADGFHDLSSITTVPGSLHRDDGEKDINVPGHLASDPVPLTDAQAQNVRDYFDKVQENPGSYDLTNRNCVDFANGALAAAGTGKDVGAVLTPAQQDQMGGAEIYRNSKYPDNSGLSYPMPPAPVDSSGKAPNPFLDSPTANALPFVKNSPVPAAGQQSDAGGSADPGTDSSSLAANQNDTGQDTADTDDTDDSTDATALAANQDDDDDDGPLTDDEATQLTQNLAPDNMVLNDLDA
jgi:hypothetical protein